MTRPFAVQGLGEIALRCRDMDAMLDFYTDVIGLAVLRDAVNGIAFLKIASGFGGHTTVLALFEEPSQAAPTRLHHFALTVAYDRQDAAVAWLAARRLAPRVEVFPWIGWRGVFIQDPEGNTVELVARDPGWKPSEREGRDAT